MIGMKGSYSDGTELITSLSILDHFGANTPTRTNKNGPKGVGGAAGGRGAVGWPYLGPGDVIWATLWPLCERHCMCYLLKQIFGLQGGNAASRPQTSKLY